ncbi:hypothetical protein MMC18_000710 [Xylographa bjoerkii]|nr:hypothetical protein [Xylographa bjoerkii]
MDPPDKSQDDMIPPGPPPLPELGNIWPQTLQHFDLGYYPFAAILRQHISNPTTEDECSGHIHGFGKGEEGGQLSDSAAEDDVSSTFSATSFNDSESSIETAITENERSTEINVAVEVRVHTAQIVGRDGVVPRDEVSSSDRPYRFQPSMFRRALAEVVDESYTLVRLSSVRHEERLQELDENIGGIPEVASITQLNDGSWEMLVRKPYLPTLQRKLSDLYQSSILDLEYDPFEPTQGDVEYWGLDCARDLYMVWLVKRAGEIIGKSWFIAKVYYAYLIENKIKGEQGRLSWLEALGETSITVWDQVWTTRDALSIPALSVGSCIER